MNEMKCYIDTIFDPDLQKWAINVNIRSDAEAWEKLHQAYWMLILAEERGIKLDKSKLLHFAADCAEDVLHIFERKHLNDDRPRRAIQEVRDYADGKIDVIDSDSPWHAVLACTEVDAEHAAKAAALAGTNVIGTVLSATYAFAWFVTWPSNWAAFDNDAWIRACNTARAKQADRLRGYFENPFLES
jgi:hypothetical protein